MWRPSVGRSVVVAWISTLVVFSVLPWCTGNATAGAVATELNSTTTTVNPGGPQVCQKPAGGATGRSTPPTGLIAYDIYSPSQGMYPFAPTLFSDASISGVDLAIGWQYLEPPDGGPAGVATPVHWGVLDCLFDQAAAANKFVVLTLEPGFNTPSWALPSGAWFMSSFAYHGQDTPRPLPEPWDANYLSEWYSFLAQVRARYETVPSFRMIAAAGPTSVSDEMSLPNLPGGKSCAKHPSNPNKCDIGWTANPPAPVGAFPPASWPPSADYSDIAMFEALGYTPAALESAWARVFATYTRFFSYQYISLALWQGLPIGSTSTSDLTQFTATPLQIIQVGSTTYPTQFVVQENGLGPSCCHQPTASFVPANCGTVVTGFQTTDPAFRLKRGRDLETYLAAGLTAAEQAGGDFVELYEPDDILSGTVTTLTPDPEVNPATAPLLASMMPPNGAPQAAGERTLRPPQHPAEAERRPQRQYRAAVRDDDPQPRQLRLRP